MRTAFDFAPLLRSAIGFENLNRLAEMAGAGDNAFPPYNIEKVSDEAYRITLAVAGFSRDELDVTSQDGALVIAGRAAEAPEGENRTFLHRGIAKRAFERRFQLADTIRVTGAAFDNGLLHIDLVREVPEHKKPRKIEIGQSSAEDEPRKLAA